MKNITTQTPIKWQAYLDCPETDQDKNTFPFGYIRQPNLIPLIMTAERAIKHIEVEIMQLPITEDLTNSKNELLRSNLDKTLSKLHTYGNSDLVGIYYNRDDDRFKVSKCNGRFTIFGEPFAGIQQAYMEEDLYLELVNNPHQQK